MRKRLFSLFLTLALLMTSIVPLQVKAYDGLAIDETISEEDQMDLILQMLADNAGYMVNQFHDTSAKYPNTGYIGLGKTSDNQGMRTNNNYTLVYAIICTEIPEESGLLTSELRATLLEQAKKAIRYGLFTHNSVKAMQTVNNAYWGPNNWQSSLHAGSLLFAAHILWNELDAETKAAAEKVAISEGTRAVKTAPGNYKDGNTHSEENAWDTNAPSIAYCMFPEHPDAEEWREASIKFAMNALSRKADAEDPTVVDGKPASEWITTWNIFDDYSLENHKILHPNYQMNANVSFTNSAVYYAYAGKEIPEAFCYNVQEVFDNVLKKLVYPTAEWTYPNGGDWLLVNPGASISAFAYEAVMFQDPEAKLLEIRALQMARQRQLISGDGRMVHISDIGLQREAVNSERLAMTYMLHKYVGDWPEKTATWEEFTSNNSETKEFLDGYLMTSHNQYRFASFSWKNRFVGFVTPNSDSYLENGYVTHPNMDNIVGGATIAGKKNDLSYLDHANENHGDGFTTIGVLREDESLDRYIAMTALPGNAVVLMEAQKAVKDVNITANNTLPMSFQTDQISGAHKSLTTAEGTRELTITEQTESGTLWSANGSWVDVDDHVTILMDQSRDMTFGEYTKPSSKAPSKGLGGCTLRFGAATGSFKAGQTVNEATNIVFSNVGADAAARLQEKVTYLTMPEGWGGVLLEDVDGTAYYVVNHFYGDAAEATAEIPAGTYGVPVILQESALSAAAAQVQLTTGELESTYEALTKFVETDKPLQAFNRAHEDAFYLSNRGAEAAEATVTFLSDGKPVQKAVTMEPGADLLFSLENGEITVVEKEMPHAPAAPTNVQAAKTGDGALVTWESSDPNAASFVIERAEPYGDYEEIAVVDGALRTYTDPVGDMVATYRYRVSAREAEGIFQSDSTESNYVSMANHVDPDGWVNLAQGKLAVLTPYVPARPGSLTVDGDLSTFCNNSSDTVPPDMSAENPVTLEIDLGASYDVNRIVLLPRVEGANCWGPKDTKILYSTDGEHYETLVEHVAFDKTQNVAKNTVEFDTVNARYICFEFASSHDSKGRDLVQICEVRVYGAEKAVQPGYPGYPESFQAQATSPYTAKLTWAEQNDATSFVIERSSDNQTWTPLAEVDADTQLYYDADAAADTTYYYRLGAKNENGTTFAAAVSVRTPSDGNENLALGLKDGNVIVTSSGPGSAYPDADFHKDYLTDGDRSTSWISKTEDETGKLQGVRPDRPQDITIRLAEPATVQTVVICPGREGNRYFGPKEVQIFVSSNGETFTEVTEKLALPEREPVNTITLPTPQLTQYVQIRITQGWDRLPAKPEESEGQLQDPARNVRVGEVEIYGVPEVDYFTTLTASLSSTTLTEGQTAEIQLEAKTASGAVLDLSSAEILYSGYDSNVATVSSDGVVTAVAAGSTTVEITAVVGGVARKAQLEITVEAPHTGGSSSSRYRITVTQVAGGKISPSTTTVSKGQDKTFTITADEGYKIADVLVDGKSVGAVSTYTFENVTAKHTITAKFEKVEEITNVGGFLDVKSNDWYAEAVQYVVDEGLMNGTSSATFSPRGATTRGMIVTILYRMAGTPAMSVESGAFNDVSLDQYYAQAAAWAAKVGIVTGYGNGNFGPNDPITREQLATMLYRYMELMGEDVSQTTSLDNFKDSGKVSAYATEALQWAVAEGIVTGKTGDVIDPLAGATRAEVATMLMRLCTL